MLNDLFNDPNWQTDQNGVVVVNITQPAAGANFSYTVPTGQRLIVTALTFSFATSAAVANRVVVVTCDDGTHIYKRMNSGSSQTASNAVAYSLSNAIYAQGTGTALVSDGITAILLGGYNLKSAVFLMDVADQLSNIYFQAIKQTRK